MEVSVDLVSVIKYMVGVCTLMENSNSIGGLGILGVRALLLTGGKII